MNPIKSVESLTGAPGSYYFHTSLCSSRLYEHMEIADQKHDIMTAMSFTRRNELVMYQNYTVLKVFALPDGQMMVKLRNPLGKDRYSGDWSDDDSIAWTD